MAEKKLMEEGCTKSIALIPKSKYADRCPLSNYLYRRPPRVALRFLLYVAEREMVRAGA